MKFFNCRNLTEQSLHGDVLPWDFVFTETITAQIRQDPTERQSWYHNTNTKHHFYSMVEPWNPNQRCTAKDNPPRLLHGLAFDYDDVLHGDYIAKAIEKMKIKPEWVEQSLGGKQRLVWTFPEPLAVGDYDFCAYVFQQSVAWLNLRVLPGLDEGQSKAPERMLCNGGTWTRIGAPIPKAIVTSFFMECGRSYKYLPPDSVNIPIADIDSALKRKFPKFATWEGNFDYETQGPSFWIEGSTSPKSAIVKREGLFTFSAHASKPFWSWAELLGQEFVKGYVAEKMGAASTGIYWDGQKYWRVNPGMRVYTPEDAVAVARYLKVAKGISGKPDRDGNSQMEKVLHHIGDHCRVECAQALLFRPPGVHSIQGKPTLNTLIYNDVMKPASEAGVWGLDGNMPFITMVLDNLFDPHSQLRHYLSWLKHYYVSALGGVGRSGQAVYLVGGPGMGKTMWSTEGVGRMVGGCSDGSKFISGGDSFGAELFERRLIVCEDEIISSSDSQKSKVEAVVKQLVANAYQRTNQKFVKAGLTEWYGRLVVSANFDLVSARMIPNLAEGIRDKVNLYLVGRKEDHPNLKFPEQHVIKETLARELPLFCEWLINTFEIPEEYIGDSRFHVTPFHHPTLRERAAQSTNASRFAELLYETLTSKFNDDPTLQEYCCTTARLQRDLQSNPLNQEILRTLRMEQLNRYLEQLSRDGYVDCYAVSKTPIIREWHFRRFKNNPTPETSHGTSVNFQSAGRSSD